jgi:hypothetical protein
MIGVHQSNRRCRFGLFRALRVANLALWHTLTPDECGDAGTQAERDGGVQTDPQSSTGAAQEPSE